MHVDVIEGFAALDSVRDDWEAVYAADPEASVFMSWRWIADCLATHRSVWLILAAKPTPADDRYVAFLPLRMQVRFHPTCGFINELSLAGGGYSDHAGLLAHPAFESAAVAALGDHLRKKLHWARLTLANLWMSDRRRRLFLSGFDAHRFVHKDITYIDPVTQTDNNVCPSVALPSDWDAYLGSLSANHRQKIRRGLRKVDAAENYAIMPADAETWGDDIDALLGFWKAKWAGRKGAKAEAIINRNRAMLSRCAHNGTLFLPVFRHRDAEGDRAVAALAILVDPVKKAMLFFIGGRDETYAEAPAGYLLHAYSLRHAIAQGFSTYHFLLGNEPYKYVFAAQEQRLKACSVATRSGRNLGETLDPRGLGAMRDMAVDLERKADIPAAERAYRQILTLQPDDPLTLYRLGRLRASRGDHAEAALHLSRSVALDPLGANAWLKLAHARHAIGDDAGALDAGREVVQLRPDSEDAKALILQLALAARRAPIAPRLWRAPPAAPRFGGAAGSPPPWMRPGPGQRGAPAPEASQGASDLTT